jgi:hypothetical protein
MLGDGERDLGWDSTQAPSSHPPAFGPLSMEGAEGGHLWGSLTATLTATPTDLHGCPRILAELRLEIRTQGGRLRLSADAVRIPVKPPR